MNRRGFIGQTLSGSVLLGTNAATPAQTQMRENAQQAEVVIEREQAGQPHKGKVLAAIQPHCDDLSLFAGGAKRSGRTPQRRSTMVHSPVADFSMRSVTGICAFLEAPALGTASTAHVSLTVALWPPASTAMFMFLASIR